MTIRVGINGFGRIGRLTFRLGVAQGIEFVGINDLSDNDNLAYLLKYDTVHGKFDGDVKASADEIIVNGKSIAALEVRDPATIPWGDLGADYVLECTGIFTDYDGAAKHLVGGAKRVILTHMSKEMLAMADQVPEECAYDGLVVEI